MLETASNGHAVLVFRDNTKVTVQPRSQFKVENFVYASDNPAEGSVVFESISADRVAGRVVEVVGVAGIIDLPELGGSAKLRAAGLNVHTLCEFNETE